MTLCHWFYFSLFVSGCLYTKSFMWHVNIANDLSKGINLPFSMTEIPEFEGGNRVWIKWFKVSVTTTIHPHNHTHTQQYTYIHTLTHTTMHTHTQLYACTHTHTRTHTHTHAHATMHTHTYTQQCTHTHARTHTLQEHNTNDPLQQKHVFKFSVSCY